MAELNWTPDNGCWFAVLTVAAKGFLEKDHALGKVPAQYKLTPNGPIMGGGYEVHSMGLMNGVKYKGLINPNMNPKNGADSTSKEFGKDKRWTEQNLSRILEDASEKHLPVGVCSTDHALVILGYNKTTGEVTIKNPWGDRQGYEPESANSWGVEMKHGVFTISLQQLMKHFDEIVAPKSVVEKANKQMKKAEAETDGSEVPADGPAG